MLGPKNQVSKIVKIPKNLELLSRQSQIFVSNHSIIFNIYILFRKKKLKDFGLDMQLIYGY